MAHRLREQASPDDLRVSIHAHREMVEEAISYESLCESLSVCVGFENNPDHQRGPCCLVCGRARSGQYLHLVCTTSLEVIIVITVYEPKPPKWLTPFQRGK